MSNSNEFAVHIQIDQLPEKNLLKIEFEENATDAIAMAIHSLIDYYKKAPKSEDFSMSPEELIAIEKTEEFLRREHFKRVWVSTTHYRCYRENVKSKEVNASGPVEVLTDGNGNIIGTQNPETEGYNVSNG
jgi:hypothetical protein